MEKEKRIRGLADTLLILLITIPGRYHFDLGMRRNPDGSL